MSEARKTPDHTARLKEQAGEITERMRVAGLTLEQAAAVLRLQVDTMRKYARGYQPASDRVMELIREHIVPTARRASHDSSRVAEEPAEASGLSPDDLKTLVDILTQECSPKKLSGLLSEVLNDVEMSPPFRSSAARLLSKTLETRLRNGSK